jgi:PIN domain nuclease of toxin-antitoxin system
VLLDTHIFVWWINEDPQLKPDHAAAIATAQPSGIEVSIISCWEIAKLVEYQRLLLSMPVLDWLNAALAYPGVRVLPLTPEIVVDSTQLPGSFHKDPADQMIVATARVCGLPLMTMDGKILLYPHVPLATI